MVDSEALEKIYKESLEEDIISYLSKVKEISLEEAMDKYYMSSLSEKINEGVYGIQYLDYKNLCEILISTEPELFQK